MLALANREGIVHCTIPGLADRARITLEQCEYALQRFQQPDKYSWSKEDEGRRVRVVEGGWFLINHAKYRALMNQDEQREKTRIRMQRYRDRNAASRSVTPVTNDACYDIAEATTEATTTTKAKKQDQHLPLARRKKDVDPRFKTFMELVDRAHRHYVKVPPVLNATLGKNLQKLLLECPQLDEKRFSLMLKHYHESADHAPGEQPAFYVTRLPRYEPGVLNQFGRAEQPNGGNGNGTKYETFAERDQRNMLEAAERVYARIVGPDENGVTIEQDASGGKNKPVGGRSRQLLSGSH